MLLAEIRQEFPEKSVWIYTGYLWDEVKDLSLMQAVDVLIDGRFERDKFSPEQPWVGSSNQRVIAAKPSLAEGRVVLYIG